MTAKLDIIVIGATGYTGRITCKYLSAHKEPFTWAMAGRDGAKLADLKASLGGTATAVETLVVDLAKPESLDAVCRRARCVISCAGPFNVCGMPVVEACVRNGVHYIDSTGEFTFVRLVAERFHEEAQKKNIALVSCCGFDSVPADLGNYVIHRAAREEMREELKEVVCFYKCRISGISSGTAHSIAEVVNYLTRGDMAPTSLNPVGGTVPVAAPTRLLMGYDWSLRSWMAPFVMAGCNERIVRRTNALNGSSASYVECLQAAGLFQAIGVTAGFLAMGVLMVLAPLRNFLLRRFFPAGVAHGPSAETKAASFFRCTFRGTTVSGRRLTTVLQSTIDMYDISGVFLGECALSALALEKRGKVRPGVMTPASAFGDELVHRSTSAGVHLTTLIESKQEDDSTVDAAAVKPASAEGVAVVEPAEASNGSADTAEEVEKHKVSVLTRPSKSPRSGSEATGAGAATPPQH